MSVHIRNVVPFLSKPKFKPNSVIVITGAGSGIGRQVALEYARRKCRLILGDIAKDSLPPVVEKCELMGSKATPVAVDVTKPEQCKALIQTAVDLYGIVDIVVLCAGLGAHHLFQDTADAKIFQRLMDVNFFGYLHCVQAAYPHLCRSRGVLCAITSFSGEVGLPYRTAYCASKFAVTGFLEALRSEMALLAKERNAAAFDIVIVCPPTVDTNLRKNSLTTDDKLKEAPSEHAITVEQCARAIIDASDRRLRKAFFPWKSWAGVYLRPLVPDLVDRSIWKRAKL